MPRGKYKKGANVAPKAKKPPMTRSKAVKHMVAAKRASARKK